MPQGLVSRPEVLDTYWYFANERLEMMYRRLDGKQIFTDDPILTRYKFCNTYRICDRVSQYLVKNVQYGRTWNEKDLLLRTVLFRLFSWPPTWDAIGGDSLSAKSFDLAVVMNLLDGRQSSGEKLYTHAFILSGMDAFGESKKHRNHLRLVQKMVFEDNLTDRVVGAESLKDVYTLLLSYPMIGRFMAYQLAIDLNYSTLINFDESSFVVAGPGAERGINKCFQSIGNNSLEDIIMYMVDSQEEHFARLNLPFSGLYGRKLQAIDCQGLFCETDKYSRVKFPELTSNRTKIKSVYSPSGDPIEFFFPPKWGIN